MKKYPGKEPAVPPEQETGWDPELFWIQWWREKIPHSAKNKTPIIQSLA
jgi:hypothetical protein